MCFEGWGGGGGGDGQTATKTTLQTVTPLSSIYI